MYYLVVHTAHKKQGFVCILFHTHRIKCNNNINNNFSSTHTKYI